MSTTLAPFVLAGLAPPGPRWLAGTSFLGNPAWIWLWSLGLAATLWAIFLGVRWVFVQRGGRLAERTATDLDDGLILLARRTSALLLFFPALHLGCRGLDLNPKIEHGLSAVTALALLVQIGIWGMVGIDFWIGRTRRSHQQKLGAETLIGTLGFIGKLVLLAVLVLLALSQVGVNVTGLVAGLGIGGIAVALALQNVLGDLLAALAIVIDRPFEIGDSITVDDLAGTVESVGLKTTRVRSVNGEQIVFANGDLLKSRIRNFKRLTERRVVLDFGVSSGTPVDLLERIPAWVRELIEAQPDVRLERVHFKKIGVSSLDFEAVYFVSSSDYLLFMDRQQAVNLALLRRFDEEGVEIALPESKLRLHRQPSSGLPRAPGAPREPGLPQASGATPPSGEPRA